MAVADGSQRRVALIAETTAGTTPSSPTFLIARTISATANIARPKLEVAERRADRRLAGTYKGLAGSSVDMSYEWSDDGVIDLLLESALNSAWSTNTLKDGTTPKSVTVEITDETGGTDTFYRVRGAQVDTLSVSITPGQAITSQARLIGMDGASAAAALGSSTYTAAGTETTFCGFDFSGLTAWGLSSPLLQSLNLNISNNLRQRHAINGSTSPYPFGIGLGRFRVTGEAMFYLQDKAEIDLDLADTIGDLVFTIGVDANKKYTFSMLNAQITGHQVRDSGNDSDIMVALSFTALHDSGDASALKILRNVA